MGNILIVEIEVKIKQIVIDQNAIWLYSCCGAILISFTKGKTYADFEAGMDRDNFLTAQEAVDWGLADEIVEKR